MSLESPESSSPIVTRAVAAGLAGQYCPVYQFEAWKRAALQLLGIFPQNLARFVISRFESLSGLPRAAVENLLIDDLVEERLHDYQEFNGPFPCVIVGSALGGASAHLALALGGPFLPQAFVLSLQGGAQDGDIRTYFRRSDSLAHRITDRNPQVLSIQHYDPIHDEWMTRYVNHLRVKLLYLPKKYQDFIERNLSPGGSVCYLDCEATWLRYRVGPSNLFQVGGWGDISADEFIQGSQRLETYCKEVGLPKNRWALPEFPLETGPESEWGSEPGMAEAVEQFCAQKGYQFIRIRLPEPQDFSRLAYQSVRLALEKENRTAAGVLIEMFSQFDATAIRQSGLLPLWLVFNTLDSLNYLKSMRSEFPTGKPVFFSPLATFTPTPDLTPWGEWQAALDGLEWQNIGARPSHYPADARALTNWTETLHRWTAEHFAPIQTLLSATEIQTLAEEIRIQAKLRPGNQPTARPKVSL
ncbi:MAG: hypothetical protein MUE67_01275 [Anaerolineales bacterium]|nr:hypothetical protein [Anaerolineales bacterium]